MKKILFIAAAALGLTACTEDYKDWILQQQPTQPVIETTGLTVEAPAALDIATVEGNVVQLFTPILENEYDDVAYTVTLTDEESGNTVDIESYNGYVYTEDLQTAIGELFGLRPVAHTVPYTVTAIAKKGNVAYKMVSSGTISLTPKAPVIEAAYYFTGSINGWDNTNTDYKLTNDGSDPYANPTFKLRIPASEDGSNIEFKMTPESGLGGDWSGCLAAGSEDGKFSYGNAGGNLVITADPDALFYDLTFNMLDQTWTATPVGFNPFIYEIGNESGWSEPHPLSGDGAGYYSAVIRLDGEFKFKPNKDNWDGDWEKASGDGTSGTLTADGGPNVDGVAAGFYLVEVNLKEMTYKLTPISGISIIGSVRGSWDTDIDMAYNEDLKCWEAREALNAGEFKFRANHDWAVNWGGTEDNLTQGGANLQLAAAGNYIIRLYLSDEAPAYCTVKEDKGFPDFLYEIGNESGWSTSHPLGGNGNGQYTGFYFLNGEFKFKPNKDNWDDDYEMLSGDAYAGTLTQDGGPNVSAPETGFYMIDVNLASMTYKLTAITAVSIIGSVKGSWDTDVDLTYNQEAGCWETEAELGAGEWKFRANHDWAINWGGSENDLNQDGANLQLAEAGTYKVQLFLSYAGKNYCTVTKK